MHSTIKAQTVGEFMVSWSLIDKGDKRALAAALMPEQVIEGTEENIARFLRVLELARPMLVMGMVAVTGKTYCRIAASSVYTVALLINEYFDHGKE